MSTFRLCPPHHHTTNRQGNPAPTAHHLDLRSHLPTLSSLPPSPLTRLGVPPHPTMPSSYPCFQCLFCKHLFASTKSLNSHLDHYLPEYCSATGAAPRRTALSCHPLPAIRYIRADAARTTEIRWKPDTVRPPDGVLWSFAVPVVSFPPPRHLIAHC